MPRFDNNIHNKATTKAGTMLLTQYFKDELLYQSRIFVPNYTYLKPIFRLERYQNILK